MTFTKEQIKLLEAKLSSSHVSVRKQSGINLSYLEGYHVIDEANRIFGFDGWSYNISFQEKEHEQIKIGAQKKDGHYIGIVVKVGVSVGLTQREDVGFGSGRSTSKVDAHELAYKEAVTDGLKRALRSFGNQFGNALYDKTQKNVTSDAPVKSKAKPKAKSDTKGDKPKMDFIKMIDDATTEEELMNFRKEYKKEILEQDNAEEIKKHFIKRKKDI